jgi:hypothetical protein
MKKQMLFFLFLLFSLASFTQNIFDKKHSYAFANSLACEGNYQLAIETLQDHLSPNHPDSLEALYLHCLFKLNQNAKLFEFLKKCIAAPQLPNFIRNQLGAICLSNDTFYNLTHDLPMDFFETDLSMRLLLLTNRENEADSILKTKPSKIDSSFYQNWLNRNSKIKQVKPGKYMLASSLIPGSGKIWLGESYDGFLSMFIVSSYTYLTLSSFQKYGMSSLFAWINLGMGAAFYGGNIIGTQRAVRRKYLYQKQLLNNELKENTYPVYCPFSCN